MRRDKNEVDLHLSCALTLCWTTTFGFCVASSQDKVGESVLGSSGHIGTNPSSANMEMFEMKCKLKGTICFLPLESLEKYWTYKK